MTEVESSPETKITTLPVSLTPKTEVSASMMVESIVVELLSKIKLLATKIAFPLKFILS